MVADDIEWDNLENENVLTGVDSSLQASGPFPFHGVEGTSGESAKAAHEPIEVGGSTVPPEVPAEAGGSAIVP